MTRFFAILITVSLASFLANYFFLLSQKKNLANESFKKIDAVLSENFEQAEQVLLFVGKRISQENPNLDLKNIHKIFVQSSEIKGYNDIFSWTLFDWVDREGYQLVNTVIGIRKDPPQMLERNYSNRANESWKMIFSETCIGNPSGLFVLPIGVQIETKNSRHAGTVAIGINIKKLLNTVESRLDKNIHFAVVDSRDDEFSFGSFDAKNNFKDISFKRPEIANQERLLFAKKMQEKYPYKIFVRFDRDEFWREVVSSSLLLTMQIVATALVVRFWKK